MLWAAFSFVNPNGKIIFNFNHLEYKNLVEETSLVFKDKNVSDPNNGHITKCVKHFI